MPKVDLTQRPSSREGLERWYTAVLAEQESSGLSVTDFAAELGVTATTLYYWRRRLAAGSSQGRRPARSQGPKGLVEVTVDRSVALVATRITEPFVVHLGDDRSIEVPRVFDDADLRRLVTVLKSC
jgi:transposase-like protein